MNDYIIPVMMRQQTTPGWYSMCTSTSAHDFFFSTRRVYVSTTTFPPHMETVIAMLEKAVGFFKEIMIKPVWYPRQGQMMRRTRENVENEI